MTTTDRVTRRTAAKAAYYPEMALDGYSRLDSAVEFYLRVDTLVTPETRLVDYGAGRGQWLDDTTSRTRRRLRDFRGRVGRVIGIDVDSAVTENPTLDEVHVVGVHDPLPLPDASVDVVVSDFTFEHIDDPAFASAELERVVRPGGWVCARTPNRRGYIGLGARAVPNAWHVKVLTLLQPGRKSEDVFPVRYRLNTPADVARWFPADRWEHVVYTAGGEPGYAGSSRVLWSILGGLLRVQPRSWQPMLLIFLRRR